MKKANRFTYLLSFSLTLALALPCGTALGQDDEFTLEEVIVTAEFREKRIQDTPLSITAISADMMESRNQITLDQISSQAPNVSLRPANASVGSSLIAYIRGVGQPDFNPAVETGVAVYVDDVYYSTITGNLLDLLDLERVEVLRGPQGTLAGRNAIGGAIKMFTRKPDGTNDGFIQITYGSDNRLDLSGAGGFTISDKLFGRFSGVSRSRDGYVTRYDYACVQGMNPPGAYGGFPTFTPLGGSGCELGKEGGQSMTAGRLALRWVPSDNFEVNFTTNRVNDKSESQPTVLVAVKDNQGSNFPWLTPNGPVAPPFASTDLNNPLFSPFSGVTVPTFFDNNGNGVYDAGDVPYDDRFVTAGTYYNYATYIDDGQSHPSPLFQGSPGSSLNQYAPSVLPPINHLQSEDYTLSFDLRMSDNVALKWISSYREYDNLFADDNDGSPFSVQQLLQHMDHEQWTHELRVNATLFDEYADLTVGAFYLDQQTDEDARVTIKYAALDFIHGPDLVPSTAKALYSQLSLHLSEDLDLTLGARYSEDEKSYTFRRRNPDLSPIQAQVTPWGWEIANPPNAAVGVNGVRVAYESDQIDYRVALDYDLTENVMVYGQIATGYKAGGNNARPFYPSQNNAFEPEELINYEAGIKSTLFDQLRLNASIFFNDYQDIQLPLNSCYYANPGEETPCASQENIGDAEVTGFELEALWRPTKAFSLDFSYAYLDFEYTRLDPRTDIDPSSTSPFTPETSWSLGAQYRFDFGNLGDLTYRLDIAYQDDIYASFINSNTALIEAHTLMNGRMAWRSNDLKWQVALEINNLTDKYHYLTLYDLYNDAGYINGQPGRPREVALTIKRIWYFD
ncbi:TonB-dependent receptor [Thermodesulfobacteriota bacterium]